MSKKKRSNRLNDPYRLILLREDTLAEVGSYRLSIMNLYILVCSLLVLIVGVVVCLIIFTPVKRMIPGYGDITESTEYLSLYNRVQGLEKQLQAQRLYTDRFSKLLTGQVDTIDARIDQQASISETEPIADRFFDLKDDESEEENAIESAAGAPGSETVNSSPRGDEGQMNTSRLLSPHLADYLFFVTPVKGKISAGFDSEKDHFGVDVLAPKDTPIKAVLDGYVIASDWTLETGNTIGIQHSNSIVSFYKHNSINLKKLGSFVKAGEAVAIIGNTGSISSGPHLHFELWVDGKPIDPSRLIDFE